jgi:hypothetical protein
MATFEEKLKYVEDFVQNNLGISYLDLMQNWNDKNTAINLINDTLTEKQRQYLESTLTNLHAMDNRTYIDFAKNLVVNWLLEDAVVEVFNNFILAGSDLTLYYNGNDADRKFSKRATEDPDFAIADKNDNIVSFIELKADYSGFVTSSKSVDLRDNGYEKLRKYNGYLLVIDFNNQVFYFANIYDLQAQHINNPAWNGKPAYRLDLSSAFSDQLSNLKDLGSNFDFEGDEQEEDDDW